MNRLALALVITIYAGTVLAQTVGSSGTSLIGQDSTNKVITTAVPFLMITPDSRAAGMGDAGVATSPDGNSAHWNAAKLVFIDKGYGVSASYTPWLGKIINDMSIFYLSGFYKLNNKQVIAASMKYFNLGEVQFNQGPDPADLLGRYNPREFAFDVTYSTKLTEQMSIGGSLRYIHSNLTGYLSTNSFDARPGNSVAVDFGMYYNKPIVWKNSNLAFGATITNLGGKISYSDANNKDFLPTNLRIGSAYRMELNQMSTLAFALDFNKLMVPSPAPGSKTKPMLSGVLGSFTDAKGGLSEELAEITTSLGMEYWYNNTVAARLGYFYEAKDKGNRKYLTAGLGVRYEKFGLDVAYLVPTNKRENALAETLRFTLMMVFKQKEKEEEPVTD
ncbi:MAG TPA: type IX secretion system outer membrane channel protein PorV [Cyclobacteriaceae bacterium]|nr:type IX secretion system outer membrane channel protein PorV [Cyclobacteriaceae bacterium]HQQ97493.1 type IX secretion system outer membrane channel protein PorV [Cyclobacteriaceae bacterium]